MLSREFHRDKLTIGVVKPDHTLAGLWVLGAERDDHILIIVLGVRKVIVMLFFFLFVLTSSKDMSSFFFPNLVGLIMVCVLIQEWREEMPSRMPWASSSPFPPFPPFFLATSYNKLLSYSAII